MESPCLNICTFDKRLGICTACRRTIDEIARWGSMSDAERAAIMAALPRRRR
ncbi:DUF1289 domain-containing protein [Aureimonas sp. OT7]|uniref:DUF1289 domain-containing protein n=1 Tax=Aureimonas sp. OT7 TaxID=2816454 RepID=UPI0017853D5C|nr:DUF1289 domain-containing protein [Aureimonas sp. OT7]QOG06474.1 DUF1289 domain-containing protein [Aureimonas sp. OT7]